MTGDLLLDVRGLKTYFGDRTRPLRAVDGICFGVRMGETAALVGESGCGKSVTALSLTGLLPAPPAFHPGGEILFDGQDVLKMSGAELRALRGARIAYVFQEPGAALNPVMRAGRQIAEAVRAHRSGVDARAETLRLMRLVGLPDPEYRQRAFAHELSGGMQQRVGLAMALAGRPQILVADEPTTALDVTVQAQILELLRAVQRAFGMAVLLITHNLGLVADIAHTVFVMYAGRIVESGPVADVLRTPAHPYTHGLLQAVPRLRTGREAACRRADGPPLRGIPGCVPPADRLPPGCTFAPRCAQARPVCRRDEPELQPLAARRAVRCRFPLCASAGRKEAAACC